MSEALRAEAARLLRTGPAEAAVEAHERLVAARPDLADAWYNLGWLQRRARRFEAALGSYAEALVRGIADPQEVHLNRAVILADHLGRADEAEAELAQALALHPGFAPALLNLGNLHEDRGQRDAAREAYGRALAAEPGNVLALVRLAGVTKVKDDSAAIVEQLRKALARRDLTAQDHADLGFALGRALDEAAAYDEAFAAYTAANRAARGAAAAMGLRYDRKAHEAFIDRLIAAFPSAPDAGGGEGDAPLFICGMFRSGSTLAERILAGHSRVSAGGELELIPAMVATELRPYPEALTEAGQHRLERLRQDYLAEVRRVHPAGLVTDKRPDNFLHIGLIKTLFPTAKIVHTVREPLDTCLSVYFLHLDYGMAYANDLGDIAHWYGQYRRLMAHWRTLWPGDILDLDYDALVADPGPEVERLLAFAGLEWEEGLLDFHERAGVVRTASVWQVREPLYRRSSGRWRHYERHLGPLREALGSEDKSPHRSA